MTCISEAKFAEICRGIREDRELITKHNPIGTESEILLWMLLSCLISYLSLTNNEIPCFTGAPDERTYRDAILFVLRGRQGSPFDASELMDEMIR